jgi:single-stranded-DNA-specific exonuclease
MSRLFLDVRQSVCGRVWRDRLDERATARALAITQRHGVSELLARVLAGRDVEADAVEEFLDPTVRRLMPDPDVLTDMPKAAARIADAIERHERIAIFGDYDVDGATSAAVLAKFLRHAGGDPLIHIPDRLFEATARIPRRFARWRKKARGCWSRSTAAPPASLRSLWRSRSGSTW